MDSSQIPALRIQSGGSGHVDPAGKFVLYWMTAYRRATWNFSLQRAVEWAVAAGKPLLVVEVLHVGRPWDSRRHHQFVLDGMADNAEHFARHGIAYRPCVEPVAGHAGHVLGALARRACVVVTDDFPEAGLADAGATPWRDFAVRVEEVDSNGLLPMRAAEKVFVTAHSFRRFLHRCLPDHWHDLPKPDPLGRVTLPPLGPWPREIACRGPASSQPWSNASSLLEGLPLDHQVRPVETRGGSRAAHAALTKFLKDGLPRYASLRNQPSERVTSGLSPYLHFGHVSAQEIFARIVRRAGASLDPLARPALDPGLPSWGIDEGAGTFLDQLITWRELGFNMAVHREDYDRYESLPEWARRTMAAHAEDPRSPVYTREEFEGARTHDPLWNAAQVQLVREGCIHNYLRMLWGKKILQWSASPREALATMIELNNKYALDGQDPNSYSGIFWILGRYDRPWGPVRPIFGTVRYMSSESAARKLRVKEYLRQYATIE